MTRGYQYPNLGLQVDITIVTLLLTLLTKSPDPLSMTGGYDLKVYSFS